MSNHSSVYSEKKIAAYESLFKESSFAKPQEVYLTITVAHLFGQAYIMEQQGTKEGDPVYSRFVCPLEDITKVYINDNVKASPLFIQCDTDVKGVVHRKRIIVPCLENVASIVEQIKEVQALHMEKVEAALEKEKQKKREELESARMKEQLASQAKSKIPPLPAVDVIKDAAPTPVKEAPKAEVKEAPKAKKEAPKAESKPAVKPLKSVEDLNSEVAESLKALASFENMLHSKNESKPQAAPKPKAVEKPKAAVMDFDSIPDAVAPVKPAKEAPQAETKPLPVIEELPEIAAVAAEPAPITAPAEEAIPEITSVPEEIPAVAETPVINEIPAIEDIPAVKETPAPKAAPKPARVNPNGTASSLNDFESAVKELKSKLDSGEITAEEFSAQKKNLLATLY